MCLGHCQLIISDDPTCLTHPTIRDSANQPTTLPVKMLRLRVRSSAGVKTISVDKSCTLHQLKSQLNASALLSGYPPRPIDASEGASVADLFSDGDTLVVKPSSAVHGTAPVSAGNSSIGLHPMVIREVPDDNSCLFRSVNSLLSRPNVPSKVFELREVVSSVIASAPQLYGEAFLGRPNSEYCAWILSENSWGGAIELSILAERFAIEIAAFDVKTMRLDRYGEGNGFPKVGYLVYDGIHYNYMASPRGGADVTLVNVEDYRSLLNAQKIAQQKHDERKFTDTANFTLICLDCGAILKGEEEALAHAQATGHTNFREK
eukprot:GFKZ01015865.1.p1 GENE.GFKZ01015865.1~~GFKZ01015865.1.p1  ORF type:complete len:319 (+),score=29.38 GFKZ01015865.1:166-1122(+)